LFCLIATLLRPCMSLTVLLQRAQAYVAPNEDSGDKVKNSTNQEEKKGGDALEMVQKIKAARAPQSYSAALSSADAGKYFAFGHSQEVVAEKKHKKSKREGGDRDEVAEKTKKKKAKE
jgi:hypothetical protein